MMMLVACDNRNDIEANKKSIKKNCMSCHNNTRDFVGPSFEYLSDRIDKKEFEIFLECVSNKECSDSSHPKVLFENTDINRISSYILNKEWVQPR
tara:strand:- start:89 stop:373 length:285 start_codon:yes stop_codon:yes gene_type:complete